MGARQMWTLRDAGMGHKSSVRACVVPSVAFEAVKHQHGALRRRRILTGVGVGPSELRDTGVGPSEVPVWVLLMHL